MSIDPELLQQMEESPCYGQAHDATVTECRMCTLQMECAAKTKANSVLDEMKKLSPETEAAMKKVKKKKTEEKVVSFEKKKAEKEPKSTKKAANAPEGMPNTKKMTNEELWTLVKERGGACKEYSNPSIQKMRLIMALKETYK